MIEETYLAADGTVLDNTLIEQLASQADLNYAQSVLTPVEGQPWREATSAMKTRSIRLPEPVWALIEAHARNEHTSVSAWARQALLRSIAEASTPHA